MLWPIFPAPRTVKGQDLMQEILKPVADMMNRISALAGVRWDRCSPREDGAEGCAFGWIARDDGKSDFIILFWGGGFGFITSSADYTREFSTLIFGDDAGHNDCQRVEDVFSGSVLEAIEK